MNKQWFFALVQEINFFQFYPIGGNDELGSMKRTINLFKFTFVFFPLLLATRFFLKPHASSAKNKYKTLRFLVHCHKKCIKAEENLTLLFLSFFS